MTISGRIPVKSLDEAKTVVKKIIDYEQTLPCDPDYYRRMTFAAYFQDERPQDERDEKAYMKTMEGIRNHMISNGFDAERVYVSNNTNPQKYKYGTTIPAEMRNAIADGDEVTGMLISETSEGQLAVSTGIMVGSSFFHYRLLNFHPEPLPVNDLQHKLLNRSF